MNSRKSGNLEEELLFREAAEFVSAGAAYGWDEEGQEWRTLYGLFKVAACGPCATKKPPTDCGGLEGWKWETWMQASALHQSAATASEHFLFLLAALRPEWQEEKKRIDLTRGGRLSPSSPSDASSGKTSRAPSLAATRQAREPSRASPESREAQGAQARSENSFKEKDRQAATQSDHGLLSQSGEKSAGNADALHSPERPHENGRRGIAFESTSSTLSCTRGSALDASSSPSPLRVSPSPALSASASQESQEALAFSRQSAEPPSNASRRSDLPRTGGALETREGEVSQQETRLRLVATPVESKDNRDSKQGPASPTQAASNQDTLLRYPLPEDRLVSTRSRQESPSPNFRSQFPSFSNGSSSVGAAVAAQPSALRASARGGEASDGSDISVSSPDGLDCGEEGAVQKIGSMERTPSQQYYNSPLGQSTPRRRHRLAEPREGDSPSFLHARKGRDTVLEGETRAAAVASRENAEETVPQRVRQRARLPPRAASLGHPRLSASASFAAPVVSPETLQRVASRGDREMGKERGGEREREMERERGGEREREMERERGGEREREMERERGGEREREMERERGGEREREMERERGGEREAVPKDLRARFAALPMLPAASPRTSRLAVRRSGAVWKHSAGSLYHQWMQRWLVLDGFILKCYSDCNSVKPKTSVSLQHAIVEGLFAPDDNADLSGMAIWSFTVRWQTPTGAESWTAYPDAAFAPASASINDLRSASWTSLPGAEKEIPPNPDEKEWNFMHLGLTSEDQALNWLDAIRAAISACRLRPPALQLPTLRLPPPQIFLPLSRLISHALPLSYIARPSRSPASSLVSSRVSRHQSQPSAIGAEKTSPPSSSPPPPSASSSSSSSSASPRPSAVLTAACPLPASPVSASSGVSSAARGRSEAHSRQCLKLPRCLRPLALRLYQQAASLHFHSAGLPGNSKWTPVHMIGGRAVCVNSSNSRQWLSYTILDVPLEVVLQLLADPNLLAAAATSPRPSRGRNSWLLLDVFDSGKKSSSFSPNSLSSSLSSLSPLSPLSSSWRASSVSRAVEFSKPSGLSGGLERLGEDAKGECEADFIQLESPLLPLEASHPPNAVLRAENGAGAQSLMSRALFELLFPLVVGFLLAFLFLPRSPLAFFAAFLLLFVAAMRFLPFTRTARVRLLRSGWTEASREFGELSAAYIVARSCSAFSPRDGDSKKSRRSTSLAHRPLASPCPQTSESWMSQTLSLLGAARPVLSRLSEKSGFSRKIREVLHRASLGLSARPLDVDVEFMGWELRRNARNPWGSTSVTCFVHFSPQQTDPLAAACLPPPRKKKPQPPSSSSSSASSSSSTSSSSSSSLSLWSLSVASLAHQAVASPGSVPSWALSLLLLLGDRGRRESAWGGKNLLLSSLLAVRLFEHLDWLRGVTGLAKAPSENADAHSGRAPSAVISTSASSDPLPDSTPFLPSAQVANRSGETLLASVSSGPSDSGDSRGWEDDLAVASAVNAEQHRRVEALMYTGPEEMSAKQRDALHVLLRRYTAYGVFHRDVLLFLHVANWNVHVADALLHQLLSWKSDACIDRLEARHVHKELSKCWGYLYSHDRLGRPCLVLRLANLSVSSLSSSCGETDWKLALVFLVEEAVKSMGRDVEQLIVLLDAKNLSFKNLPIPEILQMQVTLQAFYPERLGLVLVINANWQAKLLWLSLRAQLSGLTRSKIFFLPSQPARLREFLLTFFEESRLPKWCLQLF
uniref:CRAL-TRIO domain-containing protein n=1 Tax=Neospora caninum (strain Liverpool) TaxID=572307 RepID=A0A0F7U8Y0_NEOCL|nr:TPA: hypothetical protein BN1204_013530 [Neospora caninum Liverpool]